MGDEGVTATTDYEETTFLGSGGYGFTFLVRRNTDRKELVVKKFNLKSFKSCYGKGNREGGLQDMMLLTKLQHPNIVTVYSSFQENMYCYLSMEYCQENLQSVINYRSDCNQHLRGSLIADWTSQLCLALAYLHSQKPVILHRNIKPSNVLLSSNRRIVKFTDYGVMPPYKRTGGSQSNSIDITSYTAPECCVVNRRYRGKSDVWSLGVLVYYMTTFRLPFSSADPITLKFEITTKEPKSISSHRSRDHRNFVFKLLKQDPRQRPSVGQLLAHRFLSIALAKRVAESHTWPHQNTDNVSNPGDGECPIEDLERQWQELCTRTSKLACWGNTPLHIACAKGNNLELIKFICDKNNIDVNARKEFFMGHFGNGNTPLLLACKIQANLEVIKFLVNVKGADVNSRNNYGETPLHQACQVRNNMEVINFLVTEKGALVNPERDINRKRNNLYNLPLHYASRIENNAEVVKFLVIEGKANIFVRDSYGAIPLHYACELRNNLEAIKILAYGRNPNFVTYKTYETPLHKACRILNNLEVIKFLCNEMGVDVYGKDSKGNSALHYACRVRSNLAVIKFLVKIGADVNAKNRRGQTPLFWACRCQSVKCVKFLINKYDAEVIEEHIDIVRRNDRDALIPILKRRLRMNKWRIKTFLKVKKLMKLQYGNFLY